jgi:hypothetical protein
MHLMTKLILAVALLAATLITANAQASEWYVLSYGDRACISAQGQTKEFRTPYELEKYLRTHGSMHYDKTAVLRDDTGKITTAFVGWFEENRPHHIEYFVTMRLCQEALPILLKATKSELN